MSSLLHPAPTVQPIPTNSAGLIVPRLIPVAAYLCCEQYDDTARAQILERLADGVEPRVCCMIGLLEWADLPEVDRLVRTARALDAICAKTSPAPRLAPISGGAPVATDDGVDTDRWEAMCADHDATMALVEAARPEPYPIDLDAVEPYRLDPVDEMRAYYDDLARRGRPDLADIYGD